MTNADFHDGPSNVTLWTVPLVNGHHAMLPLDAHPTPDACGACTDHMTPTFEPAVGSTSGTAFVCVASHPRMQHPVQGNMRGGCASTTWTNTNSTATTASSRPWKPITPRPTLAVSCVCAAKSLTQKGPRGDCHVCSFFFAYDAATGLGGAALLVAVCSWSDSAEGNGT